MRADIEKLELVLNRLMAAFDNGQYPFNMPWAKSPQVPENLPKNLKLGSPEHALFLFCLCYHMRGGIDSVTATRALARLYESKPEIFIAKNAISQDPKEITGLLHEVGLGFRAQEIGKFWVNNFKALVLHWEGSPVKLLEGVETYEEACERIKNKSGNGNQPENKNHGFYGFQEKMVSMLIYFLMDAGFVDSFHFPPPVDFHVLRTMFGHEILIVENESEYNYNKKTLALIRRCLSEYSLKHNVSPLRLCEAMWIISRTLCSQHPGNISNVGDYQARSTTIKPIEITWNHSQTRSYFRSCGSCPIEKTCRHNIPSAYYYVIGDIVLRGERQKPPQGFLAFGD